MSLSREGKARVGNLIHLSVTALFFLGFAGAYWRALQDETSAWWITLAMSLLVITALVAAWTSW